MKNQALIAFGFAVTLSIVPASAQAAQKATIPFSFEVGGAAYPEGVYTVQRLDRVPIMKLTNLTNNRAVFVGGAVPLGDARHQASKLVFSDHGGDRLTLVEVWFPGYAGMGTSPNGSKDVSAKVVVQIK